MESSINKLVQILQQLGALKDVHHQTHLSKCVLYEISQTYARTQHEQMSSRNLFLRVKPQKKRLTWLKSLCKTAHSRLVTSCCLYTHCWCSSCSLNPILSSARTHVRSRNLQWHWLALHFRRNCCQSPEKASKTLSTKNPCWEEKELHAASVCCSIMGHLHNILHIRQFWDLHNCFFQINLIFSQSRCWGIKARASINDLLRGI